MKEPVDTFKKNTLGTWQIVFFVISAAAPLTCMLGGVPVSIALGNGAGIPGAYAIAGIILLIFSVGYTTMSQHIVNAGAFYSYISLGLGKHIGAGAGFIAVISYTAIQLSLYALLGFFAVEILNPLLHCSLPWYLYCLAALFIIQVLGIRKIDFNIKILGIFMLLEISILFILSIAILWQNHQTLTFYSFAPSLIFSGSPGISIMFALAAFIGFEATTIYSEECKNPKRSVPRATYISVISITAFYVFVTWVIVNAYGINQVIIAASNPADFWFDQTSKYLGTSATFITRTLLLTSIFASLLAFHHTITRYLHAMSRKKLFPSILTHTHKKFDSPHYASYLQTTIAAIGILVFVFFQADPYHLMFSWMGALGTLGILCLQWLVSIAVITYFYRTKIDTRVWHTQIAPFLGLLGLSYATLLVIYNLPVLAETRNPIIYSLPLIILGTLATGMWVSKLLITPAEQEPPLSSMSTEL